MLLLELYDLFCVALYDKPYNSRYKYSPYSGCLGRNMGCIIKARLFLFDLTQLGGNKLDEKALGKIEGLLLDCLECLLQIGDQVVGILGTDGQADGVLVDALVQQFLLAELAVGGGGAGWMTRLLTSATLASRLKIFRWSMNA